MVEEVVYFMVVGKLKTEQGAGVSKSSSRAHLQ
jgi:hypothetical protein